LGLKKKYLDGINILGLNSGERMMTYARFWANLYKFFTILSVACKVKDAITITTQAFKEGKAVVISIVHTGSDNLSKIKNKKVSSIQSCSYLIIEGLFETFQKI
jgi:hypothetical protein